MCVCVFAFASWKVMSQLLPLCLLWFRSADSVLVVVEAAASSGSAGSSEGNAPKHQRQEEADGMCAQVHAHVHVF